MARSELAMPDRSKTLRLSFAQSICAGAHVRDPRIEQAFAAIPREPFAGPGPWRIYKAGGVLDTPDDDPVYLYQNVLVALDAERGINMGEPGAHACWLNALALEAGETVVQIGAGTGYFTAILAWLVGPSGFVHAFEIAPDMAARARNNLRAMANVEVYPRSGVADDLPKADAVYVCAGADHPCREWLDALRPGGRLLFPLQPPGALGGMLLINRPERGGAPWPAHFVSRAIFVGCEGVRESKASRRLADAFFDDWRAVKSLRFDEPDETCWFAGDGWWLSSAPVDAELTV